MFKSFALVLSLAFGLNAFAGEAVSPLTAADTMNDTAMTMFGVTAVSPVLKTTAGVAYRIATISYGAGSMAPSRILVFVSGPGNGDLGGEAGYEKAFDVAQHSFISVSSYKVSGKDVVMKVKALDDNGRIVAKTLKIQLTGNGNLFVSDLL